MTGTEQFKKISKKSKEVFDFIVSYYSKNRRPPTIREVAFSLRFSSPSTAHFHIKKLENAGFLRRTGRHSRSISIDDAFIQPAIPIPVVGTIRAGMPVMADENIEYYYFIPEKLVSGECFLLRVKGDSMKDAGILPGDLLLIRQSNTINQNEIGAFMIDGEATIKKFRYVDSKPALIAENPDYETIFPQDLLILGKVILLIRSYEP